MLLTTKMSKKCVLKLEIHSDNHKKRVLQAAAGVAGVNSVAIDMEKKQITVVGDADPVYITTKLRKFVFTELLTVTPAKEEKKEQKKSDVPPVVYLSTSRIRPYDGYGYAVSDENPNACCIL